jgi:hypothetical protein
MADLGPDAVRRLTDALSERHAASNACVVTWVRAIQKTPFLAALAPWMTR